MWFSSCWGYLSEGMRIFHPTSLIHNSYSSYINCTVFINLAGKKWASYSVFLFLLLSIALHRAIKFYSLELNLFARTCSERCVISRRHDNLILKICSNAQSTEITTRPTSDSSAVPSESVCLNVLNIFWYHPHMEPVSPVITFFVIIIHNKIIIEGVRSGRAD